MWDPLAIDTVAALNHDNTRLRWLIREPTLVQRVKRFECPGGVRARRELISLIGFFDSPSELGAYSSN